MANDNPPSGTPKSPHQVTLRPGVASPVSKPSDAAMEVLLESLEEEVAEKKPGSVRSVPPPPPSRPSKAAPPVARALPGRPARDVFASEGQSEGNPRSGSKPPPVPAPAAAPSLKRLSPEREPRVQAKPTSAIPPAPSSPPSSPPRRDSGPPEVEETGFTAEARAFVRSCEAELSTQPDALRAARLHYELGRLYESPLGDLRRAAAHYQEAHSKSPEHLPTIRGARRVLIARKSYQAALPLFDAEVRITSDSAKKAAILYAKGRLLEDVMGLKTEARQAYGAALELDRSNPALLKAVEQCELDSQAWDALGRTYERLANAVSEDTRHRAALVVQRARLAESRQNNAAAATQLYETALRLDPRTPGALDALKRLHHSHGRWRELIQMLELEAELTTDDTVRTADLYRVGRLHMERLGNQDEALSSLERAAKVSPNDALVLSELVRLYEASKQYGSLVQVLQRTVESTPDAVERLGMLHRIGQLTEEQLGDEDAAVPWYEAALEIEPTYVPALQSLGKLYTRRAEWTALVRMHLAEADGTEDAQRRAAAFVRVAEILETRLERSVEAAEHHARALTLVPGYPPSFKALCRLYAEAGKWRELCELYERAVDQSRDPGHAITYLFKIGALYEDSLGDHARAAHTYRRILEIDAQHIGAIHSLQRAAERAQRYAELVEALHLEADLTRDKGAMVALLHRAGDVLEDRIGDRDAALVRYRRVLEIDPAFIPALGSIGRLYYRMGRWEDLLETYKQELQLTPRGPASVALLHKMGEVCENKIGRDEEALEWYRRAIELDATHRPSLRALARKLRERSAWAELAQILELDLFGLKDPQARARASFRVGEVYEEQLGQVERAQTAYEQCLKEIPDYRPAVDALARLRTEGRAWTKLVDGLSHEAATTRDPMLAVAALSREGELWRDELGEPRRAALAYEAVLERDPASVGALLALESLYRRLGAWDALGRLYATQARVLTDAGARVAALKELARLQEKRGVGTTEDLRNTYETILGFVKDDPLSLAALERIALEEHDLHTLVEVDTRLAEIADDPTVAAAYRTRLAESLEALGSPTALEAYRAALNEEPDNLAATRGLSRMAERLDDPVALAEAARLEARVTRNSELAARLLLRSAMVRAERLGDKRGAAGDLERALELSPNHEQVAQYLADLLLSSGQVGRLVDQLARAAASATDPARMAALGLQVARLQSEILDNRAAAIGTLNRVLKVAPERVEALQKLAELYETDGQWMEAVNLLGRVVQLGPPPDVLKQAHLHLSSLWEDRLGETARAKVSLQAVLTLDPNNRKALERLAALQLREGDPERAADVARRLVQTSTNPADRASALFHFATVERSRGNQTAARDALLEAIAIEGPEGRAANEYKRHIGHPYGWDDYARAIVQHVQHANANGAPTTAGFLELARVQDEELGLTADAVATLQRGLELSGGEAALRFDLATRLRKAQRFDDALEELQRLLEYDVTRVETWRDLAKTLQQMQRSDEVRFALAPLIVLGAASSSEVSILRTRPSRPAEALPASFGLEALVHIGLDGQGGLAAAELLASLTDGLSKLYPPDLDGFSLSSRDRITPRSGHPLRALADRVAAIFDVPEYDLYIHRLRSRGVSVELSDPPSILVPAQLPELPETQQVFMLARVFANIARRFYPVNKLTPRELEVLLASAARLVAPGFGAGLTSEDFLDDQSRRISKALSRRNRRLAEEAAARYVNAPRVDFACWVHAIDQTAARAALLVADDLPSCVEVLRRTERDLSSLTGLALVQASELIRDLLRFWVSDAASALRRRGGIVAV